MSFFNKSEEKITFFNRSALNIFFNDKYLQMHEAFENEDNELYYFSGANFIYKPECKNNTEQLDLYEIIDGIIDNTKNIEIYEVSNNDNDYFTLVYSLYNKKWIYIDCYNNFISMWDNPLFVYNIMNVMDHFMTNITTKLDLMYATNEWDSRNQIKELNNLLFTFYYSTDSTNVVLLDNVSISGYKSKNKSGIDFKLNVFQDEQKQAWINFSNCNKLITQPKLICKFTKDKFMSGELVDKFNYMCNTTDSRFLIKANYFKNLFIDSNNIKYDLYIEKCCTEELNI